MGTHDDDWAALEALAALVPPDLEELLCEPDYFGLTTATPVQRAICRAIQGLPITPDICDGAPPFSGWLQTEAENGKTHGWWDEILWSFGGKLPTPGVVPDHVHLAAAIRGAKTLIAATVAVRARWVVDFSPTLQGGGEIPRYAITSLRRKNAAQAVRHLIAAMRKPALRDYVVDVRKLDAKSAEQRHWKELIRESGGQQGGSFFLWAECGRPYEIAVAAGARAGGSLISDWSAGAAFDEASRMVGSDDGVINLDDGRSAVAERMLPGAQILEPSSPWAPFGPFYDSVQKHHGSPGSTLAIRARGPALNPPLWKDAKCRRARDRSRARGDDAYMTDCLAEFADLAEQMFPMALLKKCARAGEIPREPGHTYAATMDPATRRNAWTLTVGDRFEGRRRVVAAREWQGSSSSPARARQVLREIAAFLAAYGLDSVRTDQWGYDALVEIASDLKGSDPDYEGPARLYLLLDPMSGEERTQAAKNLRTRMDDGAVELIDHPMFIKDMFHVRRKVTQEGLRVVFMETSDGRHADFGAAALRLARLWLSDEEAQPPAKGTDERINWEEEQAAQRELEEIERQRAEMELHYG